MKGSRLVENLVLALLTLVWTTPTLALLVTALRPAEDVNSSGWWTAFASPLSLSLENFQYVLTGKGMARAFLSSLLVAIPATFFTALVASLASFALVFLRVPGQRLGVAAALALQAIPLQMTLIPVLQMLRGLGLSGTYLGIWLAHTSYGLPFGIFLMHNAFSQIPKSLIESAAMDGASARTLFLSIVLPLARAAIGSLAIFQFLWVWNDLLVALVILGGSPDVAPLTARIVSLRSSLEAGWHIQAAAAFVASALPMMVFLVGQRAFTRGILTGALKS